MHQVVVSDWENWCRNISGVNICFQRGTLRCVIPVVCVTKWDVGAYSRTTQLISCVVRLYAPTSHFREEAIWQSPEME